MKAELLGIKNEKQTFVIHGENGNEYIITCNKGDARHARLYFDNDLRKYVQELIDAAITDEEVQSHAKMKYFGCHSGLMTWSDPLRDLLIKEHDKTCTWLLQKISARMRKSLIF